MTRETVILPNNEKIGVYRIDNDINGNPRYLVHYLDIGLKDYINYPKLTKYKGKKFGGGYVIGSYNIQKEITDIWNMIQKDDINKY